MYVNGICREGLLMTNELTVSEIAIERCMLGPMMASLCYPHSTKEQDALKGKWVRVNRDLNRQSGLWHLVRFSGLA